MFGSMAESHHIHQETDHNSGQANPPQPSVINTSSTTGGGEGETAATTGETVKDEGDNQQIPPTGEADAMISKLADGCLSDPRVKAFLSVVERSCRELHLMIHMNFPPDHPIEEMGRVLLALLIRYQVCPPTQISYG